MGYVEDAEKVFKDWYSTRDKKITTSKIRGLLSGMSDIYNDVVRVEGEELPQDIVDRVRRNLLRWNDIWKHWWLITDFTAERMNKND